MNLIEEVVNAHDMTRAIRKHLHRFPELGYEVHQTADFVAGKLTE